MIRHPIPLLAVLAIACDPSSSAFEDPHGFDGEDRPDAHEEIEDAAPHAGDHPRFGLEAREGLEIGIVDLGSGPREVYYEVHDGEAIFNGDISLGDHEEIQRTTRDFREGRRGAVRTTHPWPGGVIPFEVDPALDAAVAADWMSAKDQWNDQTLISLVPHDGSWWTRYVNVTTRDSSCTSPIGKQFGWGGQDIKLSPRCDEINSLHEIGHSVGLFHEHTRTDRDDEIAIQWWNIEPENLHNYFTWDTNYDGENVGEFDRASRMLYESFSSQALNDDYPTWAYTDAGCNPLSYAAGALPEACTLNDRNPVLSAGDKATVTRQVVGTAAPTFQLENRWSGDCMRPEGGSRAEGARVIQSTCSGSASRRWREYHGEDGGVRLVNSWSWMCLARDVGSSALVQMSCTKAEEQGWEFVASVGGSWRVMRSDNECARAHTGNNSIYLSTNCDQYDSNTRRWTRLF